MMKNKLIIGISILVVAVIVYFLFPALRGGTPGTQVKLTIGRGSNLFLSPVFVAESKGFFKEEGLDVEIKDLGTGKTALATMLDTGSPDMVMAAGLPVVVNSFSRDDFIIFGGLAKSNNATKLLVREDKGIKIASDLKGKIIGLTKSSVGHYFLGIFLESNKLNLSGVEIVNLEAPDLPKTFADGRVDAISVWEPFIEKAKKIIGVNARVLSSRGLFREDLYFITKKDFIKNNQDTLVKFLKAVEKGNQFLKEHPLESIDIVSKKLNIDKVFAISQWDDYEFGLYLDQTILTALEEQARWTVENGLVQGDRIPDYRNYIDDEILSKVKPEAVQ